MKISLTQSHHFGKARAFSLVELLTVIAIISVMAASTVPALRGTLDGASLVGAGDVVTASIHLARQTAMSRNLPVELRIYRHDDGNGDNYRLLGLVIPASASGQASDEWICTAKTLPGHIIMDDTGTYSTILSGAEADATAAPWSGTESAAAPGILKNKSYVGFQFRPDGSTSLGSNQPWCLSLKNPRSQPAGDRPAANFVSIVLDSATGRTLAYQP
jgi:uncharacterized protein (TIGR02596 family)